uniref:Uncharacterized protein n=1 Tax=Setaria digitata TaxID=48799 RepID=A0A915PU96_9BILA
MIVVVIVEGVSTLEKRKPRLSCLKAASVRPSVRPSIHPSVRQSVVHHHFPAVDATTFTSAVSVYDYCQCCLTCMGLEGLRAKNECLV